MMPTSLVSGRFLWTLWAHELALVGLCMAVGLALLCGFIYFAPLFGMRRRYGLPQITR
jgi:hypothetical protein